MSYYQRLRDLREDEDKHQNDIAKILGISQQHYQLYESGKRELPMHKFIELAKYYNVSLDYIAGLTNEKRPLFHKLTEEEKAQLEEIRKLKRILALNSTNDKVKKADKVVSLGAVIYCAPPEQCENRHLHKQGAKKKARCPRAIAESFGSLRTTESACKVKPLLVLPCSRVIIKKTARNRRSHFLNNTNFVQLS